MKTITIIEREGKGKESPIRKQFNVLNFPQNFDELVTVVSDSADKKATIYSLFNTQFHVFSRGKVDHDQTVEFLDVLDVARRQANSDTVRKAILAAQLSDGQLLASGEITIEVFTERLKKAQTDLNELEKDDIAHQEKLAEQRKKRQSAKDELEQKSKNIKK